MINLFRLCKDMRDNQSPIAQEMKNRILELYRVILKPSEQTRDMMQGWRQDFRYLYGDVEDNLSSNGKLDAGSLLARYGVESIRGKETGQILDLFFSIQTFFTLWIKVMMQEMLGDPGQNLRQVRDPAQKKKRNPKQNPDWEREFTEIILGEFAVRRKIRNFCEKDWYIWPIHEMENGCLDILQKMKKDMAAYRCELSIEAIMGNCDQDPMKQMYEAIIPKELRHALGEFYTSDWLAEETLNSLQAFEGSNWKDRFVDPTCGSGAFLIRIIQNKKKEGLSVHEILDSVMGIDLNPLAVLAAKTNYLLMILDQMDVFDEITLPIYRWNILDLGEQDIHAEADTSVVADTRIVPENGDLYDKPGIDRLLKEKADVIIGNPPWVNWEYMPEEYRIGSGHLWTDYQLMSVKGRDLSFSKEDISVLITYIVLDKLLKNGGKLAFVIRQGVFKSAQNGAGFRRFRLKDECGIKVLRVDDLSGVRAFDQAATTTALLYLEKGKDTQYPVPYYVWEKSDKTRMTMDTYSNLSEVRKHFRILEKQAMPVDREDPASIWVTAEKSSIEHMDQILGRNSYKARTGVFTGGANAVYWMKVLGRKDDKVKIANITDRAKRKTRNVTAMIEPDYIFPMLRGSNVKRWKVEYDTYLLCPHTARTKNRPVGHEILEKEVPDTMKYLAGFREELDERKGFAGWEKEIQRQEFHAILRIGEYTFSKYKVIWRYIAKEFICAVIGTVEDPYLGDKMLLPNEKIMFVSTDDEMEAYYLCGVLSSDPIANLVKSYMNPTSISAHVLDKLNIPDFDRKNPIHMEIAKICKKGHKKGRNNGIQKYIDKINKLIPKLYTPFSD